MIFPLYLSSNRNVLEEMKRNSSANTNSGCKGTFAKINNFNRSIWNKNDHCEASDSFCSADNIRQDLCVLQHTGCQKPLGSGR